MNRNNYTIYKIDNYRILKIGDLAAVTEMMSTKTEPIGTAVYMVPEGDWHITLKLCLSNFTYLIIHTHRYGI